MLTGDKYSLELGAGGGLVGLALALECGVQSRLLVTDQQEMLDLMKHNVKLNNLQSRATALILNWYAAPHVFPFFSFSFFPTLDKFILMLIEYRGEPLPQLVIEQKPNVILAAECVYFEPAFPLLMQTLKDLLTLNSEAIVYFCFKKRRRADMQFVKMAKKAFKLQELLDEDRPIFQRQNISLFSLSSKTPAISPTIK